MENASPSQQQLSNLLEHYQAGRLDDAEKLATSISQDFPKHQFAWKVLGAVFGATDRNSEAAVANQTAVALSPQDPEAHNNLGSTLKQLGRLDEALTSYRQAISLKTDFVLAHYNLGNTLKQLGRLDEALTSYRQAVALKHDYDEAYYNLGNTLRELGKLDEALTSYRQAVDLKPELVQAHYNLGNTLKQLGRLDEALASYRQAVKLKPDYAEAYNNLGITLQELGRLGEAEASYTKAIVLKPDYTEAHRHITLMRKYNGEDEHYSKMLELYLNENISKEQRCHINFGLAKAYEDLGDFERAFQHYSEGNMLRKKLLNYDINQDLELFKKLKSSYPKIEKNSLKLDKLSKNLMPIFIVGIPRSGTTLVEQIISSHSEVTGAGELNFVAQFGAAIATDFIEPNNESLLDFRHKYLNRLQKVSKGNLIVTDKMPQNFRYIGLIAATFPEAKIIHVKRDPAAVCWSNYKKYFESKSIGYCYAIDDVIPKIFKFIHKNNSYIKIPNVYEKISTNRLLVMEFLNGKKLIEYKNAPQKTRNELAKKLFMAWYLPFYKYGIIHGDPHLGNYSVDNKNNINLFDYGCVRIFPPKFVKGVIDLYFALKEKDNKKIKTAYQVWGFKDIDDKLMNVLNKWALFLYDPILKNEVRKIQDSDSGIYGAKIASEVHRELKKYGGVKPPREFVFMDRAAVGLGSIFIHLKAEINWYKLFHELIKDFSVKSVESNQKKAFKFAGL